MDFYIKSNDGFHFLIIINGKRIECACETALEWDLWVLEIQKARLQNPLDNSLAEKISPRKETTGNSVKAMPNHESMGTNFKGSRLYSSLVQNDKGMTQVAEVAEGTVETGFWQNAITPVPRNEVFTAKLPMDLLQSCTLGG